MTNASLSGVSNDLDDVISLDDVTFSGGDGNDRIAGSSDADVLLHVICDALLGARAMGDIGAHFPDTDPAYKGIDSKILLRETVEKVCTEGWSVVNVDATVCLERPKLRPHIDDMRACIADILKIPMECVGVKATTTERLGFVGKGEGISAHAAVLLGR